MPQNQYVISVLEVLAREVVTLMVLNFYDQKQKHVCISLTSVVASQMFNKSACKVTPKVCVRLWGYHFHTLVNK